MKKTRRVNTTYHSCVACGASPFNHHPRHRALCSPCFAQHKQKQEADRYKADRAAMCARTAKWRRKTREQDPIGYWVYKAINNAKSRAKVRGVPFDLTADYVRGLVVPVCPALGVDLEYFNSKSTDSSASLDAFVPHLGYIVGNVYVVSKLANSIKTNATAAQVAAVGKWMQDTNEA
jgi:hypothetical protein